MLLPWWQPTGLLPLFLPLRPGPRRVVPAPPALVHAAGGLPIYGAINPFQYAGMVIDPGELFFRAGNPIGGPAERYRGVAISTFPFYASVRGPGAPLSPGGIGIAGVPILP